MDATIEALVADAGNALRELLLAANLELSDFLAANVDTRTYIDTEALVTINAVGVAMALLALEQLITRTRQLRSRLSAKRSKLMRRAMNATFCAGIPHMISIMWVLASRTTCAETCPSQVVQWNLAIATNYTIIGMGALLLAIFVLFGDLLGSPVRHRHPPSILRDDQ